MPHSLTIDDLRNAWNAPTERRRRSDVRDLISIYSNEWKDLLIEKINDRFLEQNAEKLRAQPDSSINLLRWVVDEIGAIYTEPCRRTVEGQADGLEAYEAGGLVDQFLDQACKLTQLCREVAIRPLWNEKKQAFSYDIITPDKFSVIPDPIDPLEVLAIIIKLPGAETGAQACYSVWTEGTHCKTDASFRPIYSEQNPDHTNPYGLIPYVISHARFPALSFFNEQDSFALRDATLDAGVRMTDHAHLRHFQSFKQLAITGTTDEALGRLSLDPSAVALIKNPQASVSVLDLQADLREHLETIHLATRPTLTMSGIWQDVIRGSSESSSGYALSLKMHKQETEWKHLRGLWLLYERALYKIASIVGQVDAGLTLPAGLLEIEFPKIGAQANPLDQAAVAEKYQILGMSRRNIWREVFGKSEAWIEQNEIELAEQELLDAPIEIPTTQTTEEEEEEDSQVVLAEEDFEDEGELLA